MIYLAAVVRLPWSFAWPFAGLLAAEVGLGMVLVTFESEFWETVLTLLVLLTLSVISVCFLATVLGLRALRLDALHGSAADEAADAVAEAAAARAGSERERVRADRILLRIGSLRISTTRKSPSGEG